MPDITSPLTGSANIVLEKQIPASEIIATYKKEGSIDVSTLLNGIEYVQVYKCLDSGYRFYYPFNIAGDGKFYEQLQKFSWYYVEWKWEHENALKYITSSSKVLEIGCAKGSFVERLTKQNIYAVGLELNENAVEEGKKRGIQVYNEMIQTHAKSNPEKYDVVCSFQVMEHITNIKEVIQASIDALKKGGKLIISVPNNDSFLKLSSINYLNAPPHHMGLWNVNSLINIQDIFNLKLVSVDLEPLQEYHKNYFADTITSYLVKNRSLSGRIINKIFRLTYPLNIFLFSRKFKAFTIQAIFEKL